MLSQFAGPRLRSSLIRTVGAVRCRKLPPSGSILHFHLSWMYAETASFAAPAFPTRREMLSRPFAAATMESDASFSVRTALQARTSWTCSPRSTPRPLYVCKCSANSECFIWQRSINVAKCTDVFSASQITSVLSRTLETCHARLVGSFILSHSLPTAALASGILVACVTGKRRVFQSVKVLRMVSFVRDLILVRSEQLSPFTI